MKIRTITAGVHVDITRLDEQMEQAGLMLSSGRELLIAGGFDVQTIRLSTQSWEEFPHTTFEGLNETVKEIERSARSAGIDFISIGPSTTPGLIEKVPELLEETTYVCVSAFLGSKGTGPLEDNIQAAARTVLANSIISADGSRNFMFASIASCPPDIPFFPAGYHGEPPPSFTVGLESGDIVLKASERSPDLDQFRKLLAHIYEKELRSIQDISFAISDHTQFEFRGIDPSFAPGLSKDASIAFAIERLTGSPFGSHGTLAAVAAITKALDDIDIRKCGYSGLMLPILEDEGLARSADLGSLDLQKLLLYSSVCGTGLDAVPLPGDTSTERISSVIRDVSYLSIKWNKPLSARLLPIPDKVAGDLTELNSPYLRDCSILSVI